MLVEELEGGDFPNLPPYCDDWNGLEFCTYHTGSAWPLCSRAWCVIAQGLPRPQHADGQLWLCLTCTGSGENCDGLVLSVPFGAINACFGHSGSHPPSPSCRRPCFSSYDLVITCNCDPFEFVYEFSIEFGCDGQYLDATGQWRCVNPYQHRRWRLTFRECDPDNLPPPPPPPPPPVF